MLQNISADQALETFEWAGCDRGFFRRVPGEPNSSEINRLTLYILS